MPRPTFFVIGAQKCGTTSLYYYLKQHPEIHMSSRKEPKYFANSPETAKWTGPRDQIWVSKWPKTLDLYLSYYDGATDEKALGEASPEYIVLPWVPGNIQKVVSNPKIIAILRDPVDRAYSQHVMYLRLATEPCLDFLEAAKEEFKRVESGWGPLCWYVHRGFYHRQLMPYYDAFGAENIRVYLSGDLKRDPVGTMQDMFRFLGVDDTFVPDTATDYNAGTMPKSFAVHHFLMKENAVRSALAKVLPRTVKDSAVKTIKRMNSGQKKSGPSPEARSFLIDVYREDILKLQDLIQRDLTAWLTIDKKERDPSDAPS